MNNDAKNKDPLPSLKAAVALIVATGAIVSGIWAFFFVRTSDLKDQQITLLERRNEDLRETGIVPEAVRRLENRLIPLTLAFPMDSVDGRVKVGIGIETPTEITMLIAKAEDLRKQKKYDLAGDALNEIDRIYPGFNGTPYFRFLIERDKNNPKDGLAFAEQALAKLPEDKRMLSAYEFAIKAHLQNGNKKRAEDLCLVAIRLDPENDRWREFFKQAFGYEPTISAKGK